VDWSGDLNAQFCGSGDPLEVHAGQEGSPAEGLGDRQQAEDTDDGGRKFHRRLRLL
jgi:hypothetical protein